jgi:REP element-mobilizing transposase RayT
MRAPLAYHLTWTCYGQWLQGDARGYVDKHNRTPGEEYPAANLQYRTASANRMAEATCWLTDDQRRTATAAIAEASLHRGWRLLRVNVQPDHVHLVLSAPDVMGKRAMKALKSWATMQLNAHFARRQHWWTKGGKVEVINDERYLRQAIDYVGDQPYPEV